VVWLQKFSQRISGETEESFWITTPGVSLMMIVLLIAGIGAVLAGLLAIAFGIPIKEFGFGNTLILVGVIGTCTGMILLGLWLAVRELKIIAQRLRPVDTRARTALPSIVPGAVEPSIAAAGDEEFAFGRDRAATENAGNTPSGAPPPWLDEAASRVRVDAPTAPEVAEPAPVPKPRRNLLFSSTSRKERERAEARGAEPTAPAPPVVPPVPEPEEAPPATFDDAWPKSERARGAEVPPQRRGGRTPSTFPEANGADQPPVTVLKSGVVDGMAYSLYSDGSIEAQMPEGMMRFASIDELRAHLDHRP
jgi:hypothetical protein